MNIFVAKNVLFIKDTIFYISLWVLWPVYSIFVTSLIWRSCAPGGRTWEKHHASVQCTGFCFVWLKCVDENIMPPAPKAWGGKRVYCYGLYCIPFTSVAHAHSDLFVTRNLTSAQFVQNDFILHYTVQCRYIISNSKSIVHQLYV